MSTQTLNLSDEELEFYAKLTQKSNLVAISYDKQEVYFDGVNQGTFDNLKAVYAADWNEAQSKIQNTNTKISGTTYNSVVCSATNIDLLSVTATVVSMGAIVQTNVPIRFSNGNTLVIADNADLANFLAQWYPFREGVSEGYTYEDEA